MAANVWFLCSMWGLSTNLILIYIRNIKLGSICPTKCQEPLWVSEQSLNPSPGSGHVLKWAWVTRRLTPGSCLYAEAIVIPETWSSRYNCDSELTNLKTNLIYFILSATNSKWVFMTQNCRHIFLVSATFSVMCKAHDDLRPDYCLIAGVLSQDQGLSWSLITTPQILSSRLRDGPHHPSTVHCLPFASTHVSLSHAQKL